MLMAAFHQIIAPMYQRNGGNRKASKVRGSREDRAGGASISGGFSVPAVTEVLARDHSNPAHLRRGSTLPLT